MRTILSGPESIGAARELLAAGHPVAVPTETVYGLAADALNPVAVARIFEAKERPHFDPLIVHLPDLSWLEQLASDIPPLALRLAGRFWPGPLTLVLPKTPLVPDLVTSGLPSVALRMPAHPLFRDLLAAFGKPLAAPSANRFGRISPTCAADVMEELGGRIPLILDGGPCPHGIESTIVSVSGDRLRVLRHGPIPSEELSGFAPVGQDLRDLPASSPEAAPGQLESHYAPRTPLRIDPDAASKPDPRAGLLAFRRAVTGFGAAEILSPSGDMAEAAANLFGALRRLDAAGLDAILAEPLPETGIGRAIMERLRKAAAPRPGG
jgi:L-threonylcarbamoyladenylate synthase